VGAASPFFAEEVLDPTVLEATAFAATAFAATMSLFDRRILGRKDD
jgi:hypothetical protein